MVFNVCGDVWIWEKWQGQRHLVATTGSAALHGLGGFQIGLNVDTSAATYKAHYEDDEGNEEQDFSQVCCAACETAEAEYGCDQGYNEKGDGPS